MTETPAPDALAEDLMVPIRSALRFAASHSCITAAQEKAILTALRANDQRNAVIEECARVVEGWDDTLLCIMGTDQTSDLAQAIRARKEQP